MSIDPQKVTELKAFIATVDAQPQLLNLPELKFFKDYLTKMGASKIPNSGSAATGGAGGADKTSGSDCHSPKSNKTSKPTVESVDSDEEEEKVVEESDPEEVEPEIPDYVSDGEDEEGMRLEKESEDLQTLEMGKSVEEMGDKELTDDEMDKQGALKGEAQDAIEDGDLKKAIEKLTEAFQIGNVTAMMYSKRGDLLLKCKRPVAAIKDCTKALELNPDSAKAARVKGIAERRLGMWEEAHKDLELAQKLDYDDDTESHRKFVAQKWKKIDKIKVEQRLQKERKAEEEKKKRIKKAQAERKKAAAAQKKRDEEEEAKMGGMPGGFPGMPGGFPGKGGMPGGGFPGMPGMGGKGGMPGMGGKGKGGVPGGMGDLLSDPDLMAAMSNPKVMGAFSEIMQNPAAFAKYQNDPEVKSVMEKMMGKMGGAGGGMPGMPGGMGGMFGGAGGAPEPPAGGVGGFSNVEECD